MKSQENYSQLTALQKDKLISELLAQNRLLLKQNEHLQWEVKKLTRQVKELKSQLKQNSRNSSKPPSSDGYEKPKPKSLREKSNRKLGGQGNKDFTCLEQTATPDKLTYHKLTHCPDCHHSLKHTALLGYESRQVIDIPPLTLEVTEHRVEQRVCYHCLEIKTAFFPPLVKQPVQYGHEVKALVTYLHEYQLIPYQRLQQLFNDLFSRKISQGFFVNITQQCYNHLANVDKLIQQHLQQADYLHHDESGIRVKESLYWCHVASTPELTYYSIAPQRGREAIDRIGILPPFKGWLIHDGFKPYFHYACEHALCNAHHLRELTFIAQEHGQVWAKHMADLLRAIKKQLTWHQAHGLTLSAQRLHAYERCYDELIMMGLWHPDNIRLASGKKKMKQTKAKNLLDCLRFHKAYVLAFMHYPPIPFTNNQAEQDIRMVKVKQKISGCFRSYRGAQCFARIRTYLSSAKKQGQNILRVLVDAFNDQPFIPDKV